MLRDGHFRIHRSAFSHPIVGIARPLRFALWQWMIGEAYFKDSGELRRGQFSATNRQLADVVGMPLGTLKTFKAELVEAGIVSVSRPTSARAPSVWTVSNYDEFQSKTPNPSPNPSIAINPTPADQAVIGVSDGSETATQPIAQPIDSHPYKENPRTKTPETPKAPKGAAQVVDEKGVVWPEDPGGDVKYPIPFDHIWQLWINGKKLKPETIGAPDKSGVYILVREHVGKGTASAADIYRSTKNYVALFTSGKEKLGCYRPARFYRRRAPYFLEHLGSDPGTPESIRDRWKNAGDAFRECAALSLHIGVELPAVPDRNYGPEWEDVEEFHPLILEFATDRSGFKTAPDDLAQRIEGAQ